MTDNIYVVEVKYSIRNELYPCTAELTVVQHPKHLTNMILPDYLRTPIQYRNTSGITSSSWEGVDSWIEKMSTLIRKRIDDVRKLDEHFKEYRHKELRETQPDDCVMTF